MDREQAINYYAAGYGSPILAQMIYEEREKIPITLEGIKNWWVNEKLPIRSYSRAMKLLAKEIYNPCKADLDIMKMVVNTILPYANANIRMLANYVRTNGLTAEGLSARLGLCKIKTERKRRKKLSGDELRKYRFCELP